jgi:hypothetical protein
MLKRCGIALCAVLAVLAVSCGRGSVETAGTPAAAVQSTSYDDLIAFFKEFREFAKPKLIDGVPDYTPAGVAKRKQELAAFRARFDAIDPSGWPVAQRIDHLLVRSELNALDFNHRIMRYWSRDPAFYNTRSIFQQHQPGTVPDPKLPLPADKVADFAVKLRAVPKILAQARSNLTEAAGDLALLAIKAKDREIQFYADLAKKLEIHHPELVADARAAGQACAEFQKWLVEIRPSLPAKAGIGKADYSWYLKNVQLFPYDWDQCLLLTQREYRRALSFMTLEKNRNRKLPPVQLMTDRADYVRRHAEAEKLLARFLREEEIYSVPDFLQPNTISGTGPLGPIRDFFQQALYRDMLVLRPHDHTGHTLDGLMTERDDRVIRGKYRPMHISAIRAEGLATGMEEWLMTAGLLDKRPQSRELTLILLAIRAARAEADLRMHSGELTFDQAIQLCVDRTPYGWMKADDTVLWGDVDLYLRQPSYGIGYLLGKVQIEGLMADRLMQVQDKFVVRDFFDQFLASGVIPVSLIRWEMTGMDDEIKKLLE